MPHYQDARGMAWTASSEHSALGLFAAVEHFMTYRSDTMARLDAILVEDPECPGAWLLKGFLLLFGRRLSLVPAAAAAQEKARSLAMETTRERQLADVLGQWAGGDLRAAAATLEAVVSENPFDILSIRLQHMNSIFFGRPEMLRSTITRSLKDWSDEIPGAGFVYGMACMGLEEVGEYERAEQLGKRGIELEPDDLWGVHSVAHIMEAQGRLSEGASWMNRPNEYWEGRSPLRHHLWWHEALFHYEAAHYDLVLERYDSLLAPVSSPGYLEMSNCASLLFRLEAAGIDCGNRWEVLVERCSIFLQDRALTFADVHMIIALTMASRLPALKRFVEALSEYSDAGDTFDQIASRRISVPLAKAMQARLAGDYRTAANILLSARYDFQYMGGSIAQRDILDLLLIDASQAAGQIRSAQRLLNEYLDRRPHSVPVQRLQEKFTA